MGKPKKRGHFCWCCDRIRAHEKFSGHGHERHICKDCSKLGKAELEYRQTVRDIERLCDWDGIVRRKQRKSFERFLSHADDRVRQYADQVAARPRQLAAGIDRDAGPSDMIEDASMTEPEEIR